MSDEAIGINQDFILNYEKDGVWLTVNKPVDLLSGISEDELFSIVAKKKIRNYNANAIIEAVKRSNGLPIKIAEPQTEEKINADIEVIVSQDKMSAWVVFHPPLGGGMSPTLDAIVQALYSKGIVFGMIEEKIRNLAEHPIYDEQILVAEGVPPQNGKNGEVRYLIDLKKDMKPTIMEDGTVNYKDIGLIENIIKGQKLAELIPPVPGTQGRNLIGAQLKCIDGKFAVIPKGRNVVLGEDNRALFADIDGQLLYTDGKISVFATHEVMADVDNSTGNICFIGNVVIRGNVLSGFEVEAGGNIEVNGVVEGAKLKAGGNIILKRGMHGIGKGELIAGGDIISKYIENATVSARGDIKAEAIMHSEVKCGNKLELGGRKGLLVGGTVRVGRLVELKSLGSPMYTATVLEVGIDPNLRERLKFIKGDLFNMEEGFSKANQAITLLNKIKNSGELSLEKREILAKSIRTKFFYGNKIHGYKKEISDIEEKLQQSADGKIKVMGSVYPGVKVAIGKSTLYIKEETKYCLMYSDKADIRFGSL